MATCRHRREYAPAFGLGIVSFVLRERARRQLAAEHDDQILVERGGKPAARGRHRGRWAPSVAPRIIDVVQVGLVGWRPEASADHMTPTFGRHHSGAVAPLR